MQTLHVWLCRSFKYNSAVYVLAKVNYRFLSMLNVAAKVGVAAAPPRYRYIGLDKCYLMPSQVWVYHGGRELEKRVRLPWV